MSNIVPFDFDSAKLPAYLSAASFASNANDLTSGVGQGYPIISIKGKVFHLVKGDEKTLITQPGTDDPASSLEVVILRANPNLSKVYYETGYVEGSDSKPTCYSNDSITPAQDAESPQSVKCATCAHNQWGSKITENDKKGKSCADSRRIAVAMPDRINEPMLIRVPAASLKGLAQFGDMLKKRGVPNYNVVVTKIGFDYTVAHPALTFKPVGFLGEVAATEAMAMATDDVTSQIIGVVAGAGPSVEPAVALEKPTAAPKPVAEKPKAIPKPAAEKPKAEVKVEAPATEPEPAAEAVEVASGALADEISAALDSLDYDD
jgi:hypothetical protein